MKEDYFHLIEEARQELWSAQGYFNQVSEPDLVDHAILTIQAAEKKYAYLLKKAREEGYSLPANIDSLRRK